MRGGRRDSTKDAARKQTDTHRREGDRGKDTSRHVERETEDRMICSVKWSPNYRE